MRKSRRRGFAVLMMLSAVFAIVILITIGLDRRTDDLDFEGMPLCRLAARSAAESAIARLRSGGGVHVSGELRGGPRNAHVAYEGERSGSRLRAKGSCVAANAPRESVVHIDAELDGANGVRTWREFGAE